jgi:2-keto-myo-inositol isomerase
MKISYNEATAKGCSSLEKDLELCEQMGFDYLEIRLDMLRDYLTRHSLSELAAFFHTSRLKPHALNAVYLYPEFLSERDSEDKKAEVMNDFMLACEAGIAIGSQYMIVVPPLQRDPLGGPFPGNREETAKECIRILSALSEMALPYGMNLCFEPVGFNRSSVRNVKEAAAIVNEVDRPNVGFALDSYNLYLYEGSNDFSSIGEADPGKIFAVHMMSGLNVPAEERGQDKRCYPDRGVVDTGNFLRNLKQAGYEGMVSIETFNPHYWREKPEHVIAMAYETTRKVLEQYECL